MQPSSSPPHSSQSDQQLITIIGSLDYLFLMITQCSIVALAILTPLLYGNWGYFQFSGLIYGALVLLNGLLATQATRSLLGYVPQPYRSLKKNLGLLLASSYIVSVTTGFLVCFVASSLLDVFQWIMAVGTLLGCPISMLTVSVFEQLYRWQVSEAASS